MIACIVIPGFELRAALRKRPGLALEPAALGPPAGAEPLIGSVTASAEASGVRPGMRMGEALATCPSLILVEPDPAAAEQAWEEVLRRLEDAGFAVDPAEPGCVYFETRGVERLYGGLEKALERALAAVGSTWDPRAGAAERRFTALAAANVARPGQALVVSDALARDFLAPLSLDLLPLAEQEQQELRELGIRRLGELARLPAPAVAERLGPEGRRAWQLARGGRRARIRGRRPPAEVAEALEFP
jgi:protein ImuB